MLVKTAFESLPVLKTEVFNDIAESFDAVDDTYWNEVAYEEGVVIIRGVSTDINGPYQVAQNLFDLDKYDNIEYTGFGESKEEDDEQGAESGFHEFEINIRLRQNIDPNAQNTAQDAAAEEGGAA